MEGSYQEARVWLEIVGSEMESWNLPKCEGIDRNNFVFVILKAVQYEQRLYTNKFAIAYADVTKFI